MKVVMVDVDREAVQHLTLEFLDVLCREKPPQPVAYVAMVSIVAGLVQGQMPTDPELEALLMDLVPVFIHRLWPDGASPPDVH